MGNKHILTNDGKFVTISDDELMHWKYIKREKVNGKWRYYYKDDKFDKANQEYSDAIKETDFRKNQAWLTNKQLSEAWEDVKAVREKGLDYFNEERRKAERHYDSVGEQNIEAHEKAEQARRNEITAQTKYSKAYGVYKRSYGHSVADFLNRSSDKIDNAKKYVADIVNKHSDGKAEKTVKKATKKAKKTVKKAEKTVGKAKKTVKKAEKSVNKSINKGKKIVDNLFKKKK